jgi:catechol 2,3-dioxygenase-like lactoylglutathione lyase family enzyme
MSASQEHQPTLDSIAPRFAVGDLGQTLAFYGQLGFALTDQWGEGFAIIARDGIDLHLHPSEEPPNASGVCWIEVNNIEALSHKDLPPNAIASPLVAQPWGFTELSIHDPFGNLIIFAERSAEKDHQPMAATPTSRPLLHAIAPRFLVGDLSQALAFYGRLGFAITYQDEGFAMVERDGISLHFEVSAGHSVCWIGVTKIEALYQQYVPTGAIQSPLTSQPWGMKEFFLCDPFRNLLLFGERISDEEASAAQGG